MTIKCKNVCVTFQVRGKVGRNVSITALDNVCIEIAPGERLGILGRNGSGKSTLLRVLGGVIPPSKGMLQNNSETLCILNINAGLNQELSARENIKFVGRLFGLDLISLDGLVTNVESFVELGEFFDLPMRCYSDGMRMRVSFGLYTALESDVLVCDEIIAAGDASFREKATLRLRDRMSLSNTLIVATHNHSVLQAYCTRAIVLSAGKIVYSGPVEDGWQFHLSELKNGVSGSVAQNYIV